MNAEKTLFTVENLGHAFYRHYEAYRPHASWLDTDAPKSKLTPDQYERLDQEINKFLAKESHYAEDFKAMPLRNSKNTPLYFFMRYGMKKTTFIFAALKMV